MHSYAQYFPPTLEHSRPSNYSNSAPHFQVPGVFWFAGISFSDLCNTLLREYLLLFVEFFFFSHVTCLLESFFNLCSSLDPVGRLACHVVISNADVCTGFCVFIYVWAHEHSTLTSKSAPNTIATPAQNDDIT